MFILKIKREILEYQEDVPAREFETTSVFIEADEVTAGGWIEGEQIGKTVESYGKALDNYESYTFGGGKQQSHGVRLIHTKRSGNEHWYLATHAWLMASNGDTIERLA